MERKNFYGKGNDAFTCLQCDAAVAPLTNGGFRNHCPYCLWCKHVDVVPGDRSETCQGSMNPMSLEKHTKKGWMIVHECISCGKKMRNTSAPDDNLETLITLM